MPNKRRFFAALLTALSLLSAWALAEIDLKPYEIESDRFTPVEILAPDMYLVLQDGLFERCQTADGTGSARPRAKGIRAAPSGRTL